MNQPMSTSTQCLDFRFVLGEVLNQNPKLGHVNAVLAATFDPSGNIVTGSADDTLIVWDQRNGSMLKRMGEVFHVMDASCGHTYEVSSLAQLPSGDIISGSWDHTAIIWNSRNGRPSHRMGRVYKEWASSNLPDRLGESDRFGHLGCISSIALLSNDRIVTGGWDNVAIVWDLKTHSIVRRLGTTHNMNPELGHTCEITGLATLPGGLIVTTSSDHIALIWDIETGKIIHRLSGHQGPIHSVDVDAHGNIVTAGADHCILIWDKNTGKIKTKLGGVTSEDPELGQQDWINAVKVLPSGLIASGGTDCDIHIWDPTNARAIDRLQGHDGCIRALACNAGGRLVSTSDDRTARVWQLR